MIEKIAKYLFKEFDKNTPKIYGWKHLPEEYKNRYRKRAEHIIKLLGLDKIKLCKCKNKK